MPADPETLVGADFYGRHVHGTLLGNPEAALAKYRTRMARELGLAGVDPSWLKERTVLDIGTGLQALVLRELGARRIYHLDIDTQQVRWLSGYCADRGVDGIHTQVADVTETLGDAHELDLAIVFGVLHHLLRPDAFLKRLRARMRPGGMVLLRCYRANSFSRYLVAELRTLARHTDIAAVRWALGQLFPLDSDPQFELDLIDDLFVPVYRPLLPEQLVADARALHTSARLIDPSPAVDFAERDENFRVRWDIPEDGTPWREDDEIPELACRETVDPRRLPFPRVGELEAAFARLDAELEAQTPREAALALVNLYRLGRRRKQLDYAKLAPASTPDSDAAKGLAERRIAAVLALAG